jgi:hypothetical protein
MIHVARRVLGAIVVLAIVAGATLALSSRPRLESDRNAVERSWLALRTPLGNRYKLVDALARAIGAAGGPTNPLVAEVNTVYASWRALAVDAPVHAAIGTANTLEGLARRLTATAAGSPILKADPAVTAALRSVTTWVAPTGVTKLNAAVVHYEKDRGGTLRRLVAGPLGFDAIPRLALTNGS